MKTFSTLSENQKAQLASIRGSLKSAAVKELAISVTSRRMMNEAIAAVESNPAFALVSRIRICKDNLEKYGCGLLKIVQLG